MTPSTILDHHTRMKWIFCFFYRFWCLDSPYLALLGPLLASKASGLTPWTCENPVSTNFRPTSFSRPPKNRIWTFYYLNLPRMASKPSSKKSTSKFCIPYLWWHVKWSLWSNFMAMSNRFILMWWSRLHIWTYVLHIAL